MLLAGLDIGTTGCKITIYHPDGEYLGRLYRDYPHMRTAEEHEVDAGLIWQAVKELLREAAERYPGIGAIGVTSFGEAFVLLDEDDKPLCNTMLYTDPRGSEECETLCAKVGRDTLTYITGVNPHSMYAIVKLMWVMNNRSEIYKAARHVCQMGEFVVYLLTGTAQVDYSLATRTLAFDVRALEWSNEIFSAVSVDKTLFSKAVPTGTSAGVLKPKMASELGLSPGVIVISAGQDQLAAAVGSGVFDAGMAVDGAGTVECITPVYEGIPEGAYMRDANYTIIPYVERNKYICYAYLYTGGALVQWFVENLAGYAAAAAAQADVPVYTLLEGTELHDHPTGILVLPHFAGAATPYMDYGSKGAIVGLTVSSTQQDIYLAVMEGVCYEMRLNMERLSDAGVHFNMLQATGGGAKSRVWMQMKADILNVTVTALRSDEAGGAGAAMMAGLAAGLYSNLREAAVKMVSAREVFLPRKEVHDRFDVIYKKYLKLYSAVRPLV